MNTTATIERLASEDIERLQVGVNKRREDRKSATIRVNAEANAIAGMAARGDWNPAEHPWQLAYTTAYAAAIEAEADARWALHLARVEWYHAMGRHAHSSNLAMCCEATRGESGLPS